MNEAFWIKWKIIEKDLKLTEPKCTCEGGRKHPDKTYHYANCPYLQFWDEHWQNVYSEVQKRKMMVTTMEAFLK